MTRHKRTRSWLTLLLAAVLTLTLAAPALAVSGVSTPSASEAGRAASGTLRFAVMSDTHYLSPSMIQAGQDYTDDLNSDRKIYTESGAIIDEMLRQVELDAPDVLLLCGDLTKDGELECHEELAQKLLALKAKLPSLKIYLVPGNHDLRNANGKNFNTADGKAVAATRTNPDDFKRVYDFVYSDESVIATYTPPAGKEAGGLSYVARPAAGYTIIAMDTCCYSSDNTDSGENEHETRGAISEDMEQWVLEQIAAAKARGDVVLGLEHHGLVEHFSMEEELMSMYLVDNYDCLAQEYADAGMSVVFTGHMHALDIAATTTESGNTLYDVETGSALTYPSPMRFVTLRRGGDNVVMDVTTKTNLGPITFTNAETDQTQTIEDVTVYAQAHGFSADMLSHVVSGYVGTALGKFVNADGILVNAIEKKLDTIVHDLCAMPVTEEQTLLDYVNFIYQTHLAGEEPDVWPLWVRTVTAKIESGELLDSVLEIVVRDAFGNAAASASRFEGLFTSAVKDRVNDYLLQIVNSFGHDSNYAADNNTSITLMGDADALLPFTDVAVGRWYYGAVLYAYWNGLFTGTSATTFAPQSSMTRGMLVTVLWRMEGAPDAADAAFSDLTASYYRKAIGWASANGIVKGYSDTSFGPDEAVTREQIATILYRYAAYKGYDTSATARLAGFTDAGEVSGWAQQGVAWAVAAGLMEGYDGRLAPQDDATRAEVAALMQRFQTGLAA